MKDVLISYETAVLAKEKGFNVWCQSQYLNKIATVTNTLKLNHLFAPTQSVLRTWLREKHMISVMPKMYTSGTYSFDIYKHNGDATGWTKMSSFMEKGRHTYEDAFEDGLFKALELLETNT